MPGVLPEFCGKLGWINRSEFPHRQPTSCYPDACIDCGNAHCTHLAKREDCVHCHFACDSCQPMSLLRLSTYTTKRIRAPVVYGTHRAIERFHPRRRRC
jgi:hypothetical protein